MVQYAAYTRGMLKPSCVQRKLLKLKASGYSYSGYFREGERRDVISKKRYLLLKNHFRHKLSCKAEYFL